MRQIFEEKLDKVIKEKEFLFNFQIEKDGIYGIEITASAKSWWQNLVGLRSFFKDDDLTLKIDNLEFPKRGLKQRRLFNGEVAFNGNNLKGKKKTDLFLIKLGKGNHTLTFLADQKPKIHSIRIYQLEENKKEINYLPKDNYPIKDGDRRQWLTIILVNLGLKNLRIKASAKQGKSFLFFKRDDADLKLIINNQIQKNQEPKSHKYWYWCGRTLKGKEKTFEKGLNLPPATHYIELWADRSPEVKEIKIGIGESPPYPIFTLKDVQEYTFRGVNGNEDYNRFDREILEAVNFWNKFFFSQKYPPKEPLNPNLVKAMIYVESRMGYYKKEGYYPSYPDVMQIANSRNPAIHTLNNDGWIDPYSKIVAREYEWTKEGIKVLDYKGKANGKTPKDSIFWGVRWLYHKAQIITKENKREWLDWKEAVKNYHRKNNYNYQKKVLKIYQKGVSPHGIKLWLFIPFLLIIFSVGIWGSYVAFNQGKVNLVFKDIDKEGDYQAIAEILDGLWYKKVNLASVYQNGANFLAIDKKLPTEITWQDLTGDGKDEIIISGHYYDNKIRKYILTKRKKKWEIIRKEDCYGELNPAFVGGAVFFESKDINKPMRMIEEDLIPYSNAPWENWKDIYSYDEKLGIYKFLKREKIKLDKNAF